MASPGKCAQPDCDREAISDRPHLCSRHTLEFFAILNGITQDRLACEASPDTNTTEEEGA